MFNIFIDKLQKRRIFERRGVMTTENLLDEALPPEEIQLADLIERAVLEPDLHLAARLALTWHQPASTMPYHNIDHALSVTANTLDICDKQKVAGYERQAIFLAALWHDAGHHLPDDKFTSKEHRSAYLAQEAIIGTCDVAKFEETILFTQLVSRLIISTHEDCVPSDRLETIINEADLANVCGDRLEMLRNTGALFIEELMLKGEAVSGTIEEVIAQHQVQFTEWLEDSKNYLHGLINRKIKDGKNSPAAVANLGQMTLEKVISALRHKS